MQTEKAMEYKDVKSNSAEDDGESVRRNETKLGENKVSFGIKFDCAHSIAVIFTSHEHSNYYIKSLLAKTSSQLKAIYSEATITIAGHNYTGESEVKNIMAKSRDYSVLLQAWTGWHNAVGPPSKFLFQKRIELENLGAKAAGYSGIFVI